MGQGRRLGSSGLRIDTMPNPKQPLHSIRFPVTPDYRAWLESAAGDTALTDYIASAIAEKAARDAMPTPPPRTHSTTGVRVDYRERQQAALEAPKD